MENLQPDDMYSAFDGTETGETSLFPPTPASLPDSRPPSPMSEDLRDDVDDAHENWLFGDGDEPEPEVGMPIPVDTHADAATDPTGGP